MNGKKYIDCVGGISAANQGHCHPKIVEAVTEQIRRLGCISRVIYTDKLGEAEEHLNKTFGYDKSLFMNTGVEAADIAIKLARRWGYEAKGIPDGEAKVIFVKGNYWGRSIAACGASDTPLYTKGFGPYGGLGFELIPYNNLSALEAKLKEDGQNIAAFMVEPIQGEAGVILPDLGYLSDVRDLCTKYNVLMISDEIQTGLGRVGKMLCTQYEDVTPDIVTLGKSISGGLLPVSVTLADDYIMNLISPGETGSTFGGNPVAAVAAVASIDVLLDEGMLDMSIQKGELLRGWVRELGLKEISLVRGKGLFNAIVFNEDIAPAVSLKVAEKGVLAKNCSPTVLRYIIYIYIYIHIYIYIYIDWLHHWLFHRLIWNKLCTPLLRL